MKGSALWCCLFLLLKVQMIDTMEQTALISVPEKRSYIDFQETSTAKPFIEANTIELSLEEIRDNHIIPVFIKDNEPVISHVEFIEATLSVANEIYSMETILNPNVRLSHPIKGRVPSAKNKPANELLEHEKTIYYERMAFIIEIPTVYDEIEGSILSLTIGGVKALNLDNLYNKKGADEHFKVFIGFKNSVCTNLCVWSDGFMDDLKVNSIGQLKACIRTLIDNYNANYHLHHLGDLLNYSITERQFAHLVGKLKMYSYLTHDLKQQIPCLLLGENQISMAVKDYYRDNSFCKDASGNISLWRLYNLFTGVNKSSYIDNYLTRNVNSYLFVEVIKSALSKGNKNWFID